MMSLVYSVVVAMYAELHFQVVVSTFIIHFQCPKCIFASVHSCGFCAIMYVQSCVQFVCILHTFVSVAMPRMMTSQMVKVLQRD